MLNEIKEEMKRDDVWRRRENKGDMTEPKQSTGQGREDEYYSLFVGPLSGVQG